MRRFFTFLFGPHRPQYLEHNGHLVVPDIAVLDSHVLAAFYYARVEGGADPALICEDLERYCEGRLTPEAFIAAWGPGEPAPSATELAYRGVLA